MNAKILVLLFCINLISAKPINVTEDLNETISKSYDIENDSTTTEQMTTTPLKTTTTTQSTTSTTQKAQETTAAINSGIINKIRYTKNIHLIFLKNSKLNVFEISSLHD